MPLTTKQLLRPRWKCIADYPDNTDSVGEILDRDWCKCVNGEDESDGIVWRISQFPHLYKKLEWWEERKIEDMPKYLKMVLARALSEYINHPEQKIQVALRHFATSKLEFHGDPNYFVSDSYGAKPYALFLPSTEEEYFKFKNK